MKSRMSFFITTIIMRKQKEYTILIERKLLRLALRSVRCEPGILEDVQDVDRRVLVPPDYVFAHVALDLAAILAVGAFEARHKTALVSEMPCQIPLPIKGLAAVGIGTVVDSALPSAEFLSHGQSTW